MQILSGCVAGYLLAGIAARLLWGPSVNNLIAAAVLAGLPDGTPAIVLTTWSFAYFSHQQRREFVVILEVASHTRPVAWLTADGPGIVEAFAEEEVPDPDGSDTCLLGTVMFDRGHQEPRLLALIQPHGRWLDWRAGPA